MKIDIQLLIKLDRLIVKKNTGTPTILAGKLGVSVRTLYNMLSFMKYKLNAPLVYDKILQTYYYTRPGEFNFAFKPDEKSNIVEEINQILYRKL